MGAQQASGPMAQVAEDFVFLLRKREDGSRWPVGTKLYADADVLPVLAQTSAFTQTVERFMRAGDGSDPRVPPTESEVSAALYSLRSALAQAEPRHG